MKVIAALIGFLLAIMASSAQASGQSSGNQPSGSNCAPGPGEGARWLASCESAAKAGNMVAAMTTGSIYWNGDGVSKDNAEAARWWKMADQMGHPEAAFALGGEAFVRATLDKKIFDLPALDEAMTWYQKAVKTDLVPEKRQQAQQQIDLILKYKQLMRHA